MTTAWSVDGIVPARSFGTMHRAKAEMQHEFCMNMRALLVLVFWPRADGVALLCLVEARGHAWEVVAMAGGVREGCPPAASARLSPLVGMRAALAMLSKPLRTRPEASSTPACVVRHALSVSGHIYYALCKRIIVMLGSSVSSILFRHKKSFRSDTVRLGWVLPRWARRLDAMA